MSRMMEDIAKRLREARENAGYDKAQDACEAFGFKYSTYAGHENGNRGIRGDALQRYASAYRVPVEWLLTGSSTSASSVAAQTDLITLGNQEYRPIAIHDVQASAGYGAFVEESMTGDYQVLRENWLQRRVRTAVSNITIIGVMGDSMQPRLREGDLVIVDSGVRKIGEDGVYILLYQDTLFIKLCQLDFESGSVLLHSYNEDYDTLTVTDKDSLHVLGYVVGKVGSV